MLWHYVNVDHCSYFLARYYYEKCPEVVSEQKTVYVEIALYLINLHSVDLKAGTFHADFYLNFKGVRITETWGGGGVWAGTW